MEIAIDAMESGAKQTLGEEEQNCSKGETYLAIRQASRTYLAIRQASRQASRLWKVPLML